MLACVPIEITRTNSLKMRGPNDSSAELAPALFRGGVASESGSSKDIATTASTSTTTCDVVRSISDSGLTSNILSVYVNYGYVVHLFVAFNVVVILACHVG